jgi:hypothetical protein
VVEAGVMSALATHAVDTAGMTALAATALPTAAIAAPVVTVVGTAVMIALLATAVAGMIGPVMLAVGSGGMSVVGIRGGAGLLGTPEDAVGTIGEGRRVAMSGGAGLGGRIARRRLDLGGMIRRFRKGSRALSSTVA